jgi:hypothetical protein
MAGGKRHHFVPKFLLRRFAETGGRWQGHIWRLDIATGRPRVAVPRTEAARGRYYDVPAEFVTDGFEPERLLATIESAAASAISKCERAAPGEPPPGLTRADIDVLTVFATLQTVRTPADRRERAYLDSIMDPEMFELRLSAPERAVQHIQAMSPELSSEEAEALRVEMIEDLRAGRVRLESPEARQVASMFLGLPDYRRACSGATGRSCDSRTVASPRAFRSWGQHLRPSPRRAVSAP